MKIKPVVGYEGYYGVTDCGTVFSCNRYIEYPDGSIRFHKGIERKPIRTNRGYLICTLSKNGVALSYHIHILVAKAFIGDIPKGYVVNHIDKNKTNNHVSNLEIITYRANCLHALGIARYTEVEQKCIELSSEMSITDITQRLNVSAKCVIGILRKYNITPIPKITQSATKRRLLKPPLRKDGESRTEAQKTHTFSLRRVERPTKEELQQLIQQYSFVALGKKYGVSDNAIRKWCKSYNLPSTKRELNNKQMECSLMVKPLIGR